MSAPVLSMDALSVAAGEIAVLSGEDSAQKTALLETIMGFRRGDVMLFGQDVSALAVEQRVRLGVGYVPAGRRVFASLTVRENIEAASSLPGPERRRRVAEMLTLFPMLAERPEARAWLLSGGQQQMLTLARAMVDRPRLLLLDQPMTGLATTIANEVRQRLDGLAQEGVAIVIAN
jgi:branched-chain amino acid transport system ATP-binding protein